MNEIVQALTDCFNQKPILNTHCHHLRDQYFENYDLDVLLKNSYTAWCHTTWENNFSSRANFLEKVRFNSSFVWLQKSLHEIYRFNEPLTAENWDKLSGLIQEAHQDRHRHIDMLRNLCGYAKIIEDAYWDPSSNNGYPELFTPTFRVNVFLFSYDPLVRDHDGNSILTLYQQEFKNTDENIAFLRQQVGVKKAQGCVALKLPIAYDRRLDFTETSQEDAQKAYRPDHSPADIKAFQDFMFFEICTIAAEMNLPLQIHTGMGRLRQTEAMWLREAIEKNPATKFVLLHCSYPWIDDITALLRYFPNVYPDLSILPLFSSSACQRMLSELIEGGTSDKVCWGCDTWTPEESYASLLAFRHSLVKTLA